MAKTKYLLQISIVTIVLGFWLGGASTAVTGDDLRPRRSSPQQAEALQIADMKPLCPPRPQV